MKRLLLCLLLGSLCLSPTQAADGSGIFPYKIHKDALSNGLQVVTVPFDSPGIVSFFMVVRVGSRNEVEKGVTGFAHFFEHCMFRGTERFTREQYDAKLQEMAAAGNANTWWDRTFYYFTGNAAELETMFDIEADRFLNLKYSEQGFKTEAGAVLGEYTKNFANPYRRIGEELQATAFKKHTYKHTVIGYIDDIKDMPNQYEYSLAFFDRFYRPEYCTLMVVGDANHERVMELSKKYFGEWKRGDYVADIPVEPEQTEMRVSHVEYPGRTNYMYVSHRGPAFSETNKDKAALDLLMQLGFSQKSDIYKRLVQEEQKVRFINPEYYDTRDPFLISVMASVFNVEDVPYVRQEVLKTLEGFKQQPVNADDLAALKSRMKYGMAASLDTPLSVGQALGSYMWITGNPESLNKTYALYDQITPEDIMKAAQDYFVEQKRIIVTLSPEEEGR